MMRACRAVRRAVIWSSNKIRFAHAVFAAFLEIGPRIDRRKKAISLFHERSGQSHPGGIARYGKEAFF